ncbi:MAG: SufE family protein [Ignavibacteria bacterium]|nr:SufE family protein [Ignavibacteria bacterium]
MSNQRVIDQLQLDLESLPDWEDRYAYIISLADRLAPFPEKYRTDTFLVKGCQSRVWLHAEINSGLVTMDADSEALIVKGLVGMLMMIFNNRTPEEILQTTDGFIEVLGLSKHLSQNRSSGLASMIKQIKLFAIAFMAQHA